jgi:hypothetical protein
MFDLNSANRFCPKVKRNLEHEEYKKNGKELRFCPTIVKIKLKNNTVFPSQKEMDRVGVEPTTSAQLSGSVSLKRIDGKAYSSNLTLSTIFSLRTL